ncbi:branched-chain amino acid ABC transporter substrate-binding protein [Spirillospora sp. NPDC047279]|uniref:branched-chain amino acid ABC transporter substrate-binding protein n=1 Tax=Spirillospora sp. NPDC047279 TaxID=3155478 RepID=UPI0033D58BDE
MTLARAGTAVLLIVSCTAACGQGLLGGDGDDDKGDILIGMDIPLTGDSAEIGPYMKNGAQLAIDEINARGGVLGGRKLKLRTEDDACDPKLAVAAASKLVSAGITMSVGGYCSTATLPTLPVFDKAKIPLITIANSAQIYQQGLKHVFLINGTGDQQAAAGLTWLAKDGARRVAVMHDNTSYSRDIAERAVAELDEPGGPDKATLEVVTPKETDFAAAVTSVLRTRPDYVFWTGYYAEGGLLIRQFRAAGYKGRFLVGDGSVATGLVKIAGGANAEGVYATMCPTPGTIPGASGWIARYRKSFGAEPGPYSTQAYDGIRLAAEALGKAGSTDGGALVAALERINGFPMFSGPLRFTPQHTISGGFEIQVVRGGRFVLQDRLR